MSPPYRWNSSESGAQTSVQMDQGSSPRTLRRSWHEVSRSMVEDLFIVRFNSFRFDSFNSKDVSD